MRLANEIAAAAMEHVRARPPAGDDRGARPPRCGRASSTARAPAGAGRSSSRSASRSSGRGPGSRRSRRRRTGRSSRASRRSSRSGSAPTATGATTRRTSCLGRARATTTRELEEQSAGGVRRRGRASAAPGASLAELDRLDPRGDRRGRLPGPAVPSRSATASARARTSRRTRTRPAAARSRRGWCSRSSPACYWEGGGGLRVEDNFLITGDRRREALPVPRRDRELRMTIDRSKLWTGDLNERRSTRSRAGRSASTTRRCATASRPSASSSAPRTSSRSPARWTRPGSTGSRRASRASRTTTGGRSS